MTIIIKVEGVIGCIGSRAPFPHVHRTYNASAYVVSQQANVIQPGLDDAILKMVREKVDEGGRAREGEEGDKLTKIQVAISAELRG